MWEKNTADGSLYMLHDVLTADSGISPAKTMDMIQSSGKGLKK
jgi:hypothetical protein